MSKQYVSNSQRACEQLRANQLKQSNWNNANPVPEFKSFCILGDREAAREILLYPERHMTMQTKPVRAVLCENGGYSFMAI